MKETVADHVSKALGIGKFRVLEAMEIPKDSRMGDYALPCFRFAREMKKSPAEIAKEFSVKIKSTDIIGKVQAAGPYINIFVSEKTLAKEVIDKILKEKEKYGSQKGDSSIVIEFPSPNTNKPLHIGHARNIILGQAMTNILNFSGNLVKVVNLNNNRGVHICKSMLAYDKFGKNDSPEKSGLKSDHLVGKYYVTFAQKAAENTDLEKEAQNLLVRWETGDKAAVELWKKMNSWALSGFTETYKKFGLKFDKEYNESDIYDKAKDVVSDGLKKGIFVKKEDGAVYADLSKYGLGEKVVLRADGTSIYITQDIYLAMLKKKDFKSDKSVVITASEQNHHFKVLFRILEMLGIAKAGESYHMNYGMVNLESGRMKSREGTVVDADDLISELSGMAEEEVKKRYPELSEKEKKARAEAIAMSALRYYFLKIDEIKDVTFKPEDSLAFEGDTGPYLLYTYARANSILGKSNKTSKVETPAQLNAYEKQLLLALSRFPEAVRDSAKSMSPHVLAVYAYQTAQLFNEFYHSSPVIGSDEEAFRLSLVKSFLVVMKACLYLLNLTVLEKM